MSVVMYCLDALPCRCLDAHNLEETSRSMRRFLIRRRFMRGEPPHKKRQDGVPPRIKTPLS